MKQWDRLCKTMDECSDCPMNGIDSPCNIDKVTLADISAEFEHTLMAWAAEHPEPRWPSWREGWKQVFPGAAHINKLCPKCILPKDKASRLCREYEFCFHGCLDTPMDEDVARRLGIKPVDDSETGKGSE